MSQWSCVLGNELISTAGSKANVTGDERLQVCAATACAPPLPYLYLYTKLTFSKNEDSQDKGHTTWHLKIEKINRLQAK